MITAVTRPAIFEAVFSGRTRLKYYDYAQHHAVIGYFQHKSEALKFRINQKELEMMRYKQIKAAILKELENGPLWEDDLRTKIDAPYICIRFALWNLRRSGAIRPAGVRYKGR